MLDLVLSLSVLSAHPQRMVTLFFRTRSLPNWLQVSIIPFYRHWQLSRAYATVKTKACRWGTGPAAFRVTETHTGAWVWKHAQTQALVTLVGSPNVNATASPPYIPKHQEIPESSRRTKNCRKQTRFLVASDLQQSFNPAGKTQQTQITIHLRLSAVERERPGHQAHILRHTWPRMRLMAQSQHTQWLFMKLKDAPEEWGQEIQGAQICVRNNWKVWPCLVTFKAGHDQPIHIPTSSSFLSLPLTSSRLTNLQHHSCKSTTRLSWQNQFGNPC